jgi:hypothetical protein
MTGPPAAFRVLSGLPANGPSPQFVPGSKTTHTEGLVLQIEPTGGTPWVVNFRFGLKSYSNVAVHPNGQCLVVIAGGAGYIVHPGQRKLIATFGRGVMGVWAVPAFNMLVFNDSGLAFAAMGPEGWLWKTRRISWDGFEAIEFAEKTIYGRGWNAVKDCWQPFSIEIATGTVRGGAFSEPGQDGIAMARELTFRGGAPLNPLVRRIGGAVIGLVAIALALLTVYLIVDGARTGELTWRWMRDNWGLAYAVLFLTGVVLVLGVRMVFHSVGRRRRLLTRSGIIAFFGIYLAAAVVVYFQTGELMIFPVLIAAAAIGGIAIRRWFS